MLDARVPEQQLKKRFEKMSGMNLEEFLGHKTRDSGSSQYLSKWRKRTPPEVVTWMHTRSKLHSVWQHNWPRIVDLRDGGRAIWGGSFKCLEDEKTVLSFQRNRDRKTGKRDVPPAVCPLCRLVEYVRDLVQEGEMSWTDVLFRYEIADGGNSEPRIMHAGGLYGGFGIKNPTQEQLKELETAGIRRDEAWMENAYAQCKYVFRVVDNSEPDKGCQIAVEQDLLGQKVRETIAKEMEGRGLEKGNPLKNPYAIKWKHCPSEKEFGKKYNALAMSNEVVPLTPEIERLIVEVDPPDISRVLEPWNIKTLRSLVEHYCQFQGLDWDTVFGPAEARCDENGNYAEPEPDDEDENPLPDEQPASPSSPKRTISAAKPAPAPPAAVQAAPSAPAEPAKKSLRKKKVEPAPPPPPAEGAEPCPVDGCGAMLGPDEMKCSKCGTEFTAVDDDAPAAGKPPF